MTDQMEAWTLLATRLAGLTVSTYSLIVVGRLLKRRLCHSVGGWVPLPILVFTASWLLTLAVTQSVLLVAQSSAVIGGWVRVLYGMSFIWSISGLAWIVSIARSAAIVVERLLPTVGVDE